VYGDALYRLSRHDSDGPWKKVADGIAAAGLQHTWRAADADRVGLLPDFYELREQESAGPAINPGTLGASAVRLFGKGEIYDFVALRKLGALVHAPGEIVVEAETAARAVLIVNGWPGNPYHVLISGAAKPLKIIGSGGAVSAGDGTTVVECAGRARLEIEWAER
jgi:hypothetical protein